MEADEYREQLNTIEDELTVLYRRRRELTRLFADEHPAVLPPPRYQSDVQQRVSRCPRCSGRLDSDEPGAKN